MLFRPDDGHDGGEGVRTPVLVQVGAGENEFRNGLIRVGVVAQRPLPGFPDRRPQPAQEPVSGVQALMRPVRRTLEAGRGTPRRKEIIRIVHCPDPSALIRRPLTPRSELWCARQSTHAVPRLPRGRGTPARLPWGGRDQALNQTLKGAAAAPGVNVPGSGGRPGKRDYWPRATRIISSRSTTFTRSRISSPLDGSGCT